MPIKCLIVEDSGFIREIYRYQLRQIADLDIVGEAIDGEEAIQKIKAIKPDLIILDLVLPLKNGLDVLKEISTISSQSRCLVVSSLDDEETKTKALALGALQFLNKPFTKEQLIQTIESIIYQYKEVRHG